MLRPETKFVDVGRDRVAYQVQGDGPPFLFLKAFGASVDGVWEHPGHLRFWRSMSSALRIVTLDHRGSGVSDALDESRQGDLDPRVEEVLAVLEGLEIDRLFVCGEFDGAFTAARFAVEYPDRVEGLVLANAAATGFAFGSSDVVLDDLHALRRRIPGVGQRLLHPIGREVD